MSTISLGVGALVAIDSFASNPQRSVREQARALLGGDIALSSRSPYPAEVTKGLDSLRREGVGIAEVTSFTSMALSPRTGFTRLAQVEAVSPGYPFYGEILTKPAGAWSHLHEGRFAFVDPDVLVALNANIGDTIALGFARFTIAGTLLSVPGDVSVATTIGPRIFIPRKYLDETSLLLFGSRSEHRTLLKLTPELPPSRFIYRFKTRLEKAQVRFRTAAETEFNLTQAIDQLRDFLSVIRLVALRVAGCEALPVAAGLVVVCSIAAFGAARAQDVKQGLGFAAAIGGAVSLLYGAAALVSISARGIVRASGPSVVTQGVPSLSRP